MSAEDRNTVAAEMDTVENVLRCASDNEVPITVYRFHNEHDPLGGVTEPCLEHVTTVWARIEPDEAPPSTEVLALDAVRARIAEFPAGRYIAFRVDGRVDLTITASVEAS